MARRREMQNGTRMARVASTGEPMVAGRQRSSSIRRMGGESGSAFMAIPSGKHSTSSTSCAINSVAAFPLPPPP